MEAPQEITTTLEAMHEWSSTIDAPQLLSLFAQGDSSIPTLQDIYQKAAQFVDQLEQQLKQVEEPVFAYWLRASAYGTYALMLRTREFLAGKKEAAAANKLADLVRVSDVGCYLCYVMLHSPHRQAWLLHPPAADCMEADKPA